MGLVRQLAVPGTSEEGLTRAAEWLEIERGAMRSQTSCAWFFDDIAGIEAGQVLRYAARAITLARADGKGLAAEMASRLETAVSNDPAAGSGREIFLRHIQPEGDALAWVAAGLVAAAEITPDVPPPAGYRVEPDGARWQLIHRRTGRRHAFDAALYVDGVALLVEVTAAWEPRPVAFPLRSLPEAPRDAVRAALRSAVIRRWFTPDELAAIAEGRIPASQEHLLALTRAVQSLQTNRSANAIQRVRDLTSLCLSDGRPAAPFDVQTVFYHLMPSLSAEDERRLEPVARALGFSTRPRQ